MTVRTTTRQVTSNVESRPMRYDEIPAGVTWADIPATLRYRDVRRLSDD